MLWYFVLGVVFGAVLASLGLCMFIANAQRR